MISLTGGFQNSSVRVLQQVVIDAGLPDHQLPFCARKVSRIKKGLNNQISFGCMKNYSSDIYKKALKRNLQII